MICTICSVQKDFVVNSSVDKRAHCLRGSADSTMRSKCSTVHRSDGSFICQFSI